MIFAHVALALATLGSPDSAVRRRPAPLPDSAQQKSVQLSDGYYTRLTIHRWGSYAELPLFAAEYALGDRLLNGSNVPDWVKPAHTTVALGLGALFTVNTITGVWNLAEAWKTPEGKRKSTIAHSVLMLVADAGFATAGAIAGDAEHSDAGARRHRNVALGSIGAATAGTVLMWVRKD